MLGRRGAVHAAFTTKELRELTKLDGVCVRVWGDALPPLSASDEAELGERALRRKYELLREIVQSAPAADDARKTIWLHFCRAPVAFVADAHGALQSVRVATTTLSGPPHAQRAHVDAHAPLTELRAEVALVAVGYASAEVADVPRDARGAVAHDGEGRVRGVERVYVTGWAKRGATGIIGSNLVDAEQTVAALWHDLAHAAPMHKDGDGDDDDGVLATLRARGVRVVAWRDWQRIDAEEQRRGALIGAPRVKVASVAEMLALV